MFLKILEFLNESFKFDWMCDEKKNVACEFLSDTCMHLFKQQNNVEETELFVLFSKELSSFCAIFGVFVQKRKIIMYQI